MSSLVPRGRRCRRGTDSPASARDNAGTSTWEEPAFEGQKLDGALFELAALALREATPDAEPLVVFESVFKAL